MTRIAAILLVLLTLCTNHPLEAQTDSAPPYLYYYSQLLGGLIIERADGTDSRQIAADVIPPNLSGLAGPGWSPSGKYFAAYPYGSRSNTPYLIDLKGQPIATWLDQVSRSMMEWSPTREDILMVIGDFNKAYKQNNLGSFIWLIDAEHDRVLAEFGMNMTVLAYSMSDITWDTAHQQIVFYLASDIYNVDDHFRVTMHFDGTTLREPVPAKDFVPMYKSMDMTSNPDIQTGDNISPSGNYKAHGIHPAQLTDNRTGHTIDLPLHTQATICRDYSWNQNEDYMITLDGNLVAGGGCGSAVIGVTNPKGTFWRELGGCSW
ncbi:MAG: hypothetical protein H0X30_13280, partial [Anaerolineae bacterium]|nr:hypothetical protein [Anaerolineae bacterium]